MQHRICKFEAKWAITFNIRTPPVEDLIFQGGN